MIIQRGSITLAAGATTATDTLALTVNRSKAILECSGSGGSTSNARENCVTVMLESNGSTITATRGASGSAVTINYIVTEDSKFSVQHFEVAYVSGTTAQALTSVATAYSWVIQTGTRQVAGSALSNACFAAIEITSSTNANVDALGSGTTTFQVVTMSAAEIERVQLVKVTQSGTSVNATITSCAASKTLLYPSLKYLSGTTALTGQKLPAYVQNSSTNILCSCVVSPASTIQTYMYVVTFTKMTITHTVVSATALLTATSNLSSTPIAGAAHINGLFGRFSTDNSATTDIPDASWRVSLSGTAWTFTRAANTQAANLSFSTWDWAGILSSSQDSPALVYNLAYDLVYPITYPLS
jgi:hypothetical protein